MVDLDYDGEIARNGNEEKEEDEKEMVSA